MTRLALLAVPALAWTPGAAYLGTCDAGVWHEGYFTGVPPCREGAADATITANRGLAVRASATPPHGATLARLRVGARVHLTAMHRAGTSPHWWGDVAPATALGKPATTVPARAPVPQDAPKAAGLLNPPASISLPADAPLTPWRPASDVPRAPRMEIDDLAPLGWLALFVAAILLVWRSGAWKWIDLRLSAYRLARDEEYLAAIIGDREIRHERAAREAEGDVLRLRVELQSAEARLLALDPAAADRVGVPPKLRLARIGGGR